MDPKQALIDADQAASDCRFADAWEALGNYWQWRKSGGFEPLGDWYSSLTSSGDTVARDIDRRLTANSTVCKDCSGSGGIEVGTPAGHDARESCRTCSGAGRLYTNQE